MAVAAIICAAGASSRMGPGKKKEYRPLPGHKDGLTVLGAALSAFAAVPEIGTIVITVPADAPDAEAAARMALPPRFFSGENGPVIQFVPGGHNRRASVYNALSLLAAGSAEKAPALVLIHDGARPWISPALIGRVITGVKKHQAVIPLLPLTETPKEIAPPSGGPGASGDDAVLIQRHLKRALVGAAQTPQAFAFPEIFAAHEQAATEEHLTGREFTDDAEIWAAFCGPVAAIPGENENRKITFPEDLA